MGKPAGKVELAWLHLKDAAPWEAIAFGAILLGVALYVLAGTMGWLDGNGAGSTYTDCVRGPRGGCE